MRGLTRATLHLGLGLALGLPLLGCGGVDGGGQPLTGLEADTHALVNQEREAEGLPGLAWEAAIADEARGHSQDMASGSVEFGHDGFDARVARLAESLPWSAAGENVAYNQGYPDPPAQAVEGWMDSTGHRENILGDFHRTGIGVAGSEATGYHFTQIFLRDP